MDENILFIASNYSRKHNGYEVLASDSPEADAVSKSHRPKTDSFAPRPIILTSDKIKI